MNSSNPRARCIFPSSVSSVSFIGVLQFSKYRSFTSLCRFIPRYFVLFDVIVSGIVSFLFLFDNSLLYRNETGVCVLLLHPATSLNSRTRSGSLLVAS